MTDPDIFSLLLARLRAECTGFAVVDEAWFAAPIDNFDVDTPACLAYLAEDGAAGEAETLRPVQPLTLSYGIWIVTPRDRYRDMRQSVRAALFGWCPSERHNPLAYTGGQTTDIRGEFVWWREFWSIDTHIRAADRSITL